MNTSTTFRELREAEACPSRYRHLAKKLGGVRKHGLDTPVPVLEILRLNGLDDAMWAVCYCRSLRPLRVKFLKADRLAWPVYDKGIFKCLKLLCAGKMSVKEYGRRCGKLWQKLSASKESALRRLCR